MMERCDSIDNQVGCLDFQSAGVDCFDLRHFQTSTDLFIIQMKGKYERTRCRRNPMGVQAEE